MAFDQTFELSQRQAQDTVSNILNHGGELALSKHARLRMSQRGYTVADIKYIIQFGKLTNTEFNEAAENWKYTFTGCDSEGDEGRVVFTLVTSRTGAACVVITVLSS